ncbi:DUF87 domain-containing protein [candidate division WWE3 bacterium]|jgi:hypothetical protein|nr:DUF87 domain-containing protein [candidate division WWE3 bacterium]MBT7350386.1 DUF87 domain-containing protein [candidate division WWE3 bacterium]
MDIGNVLYNAFWIVLYIVIAVVFLIVLTNGIAKHIRRKREKKTQYSLTFLQIKLPKESEVEIAAAEQLFTGLAGIRKPFFSALLTGQTRVSFEIVSRAEGIGFYVVVPDELALLVEKQINGAYPEAEIDIVDPNEVWDRGEYTSIAEFKLSGAPYYPIKTYADMEVDSLNSITSAMSKLTEDEALAVQYIISPASDSWRRQGQSFVGGIKAKQANPEKQVNVDPKLLEAVETKVSKVGFDVSIRLVSLSKDKINADSHLANITSSFEQFTNANYNSFKKKRAGKNLIHDFIYRRLDAKSFNIPLLDISLFRNTSLLNVEELATVFHFPNVNVQTPKIQWLQSRKSAAPVNLPKEGEMYLGKSKFRGVETDIFQKREDRRRHTYIIGQTGTGKSTELMFMVQQDIKNGEGLCLIDPHGSDIDELLETIPPERAEDVILFDVSDYERPLGLNILEAETEEQKNMVINAFISLLYKLYDPNRTGMIGPQLERTVRNVMLTAMTDPEATLVDVLRLLIDGEYYKKFLPQLQDPLVKRYWTDEIANTSDFHKSEKLGYMVSKFDRFVTERMMRNIIGQPKSPLDFAKIMEEKKILLVDLSKGKIGEENSNFLGLILVPKLLSAAMGRHNLLGKEDFPDFYFYVDEFQNFATPDFATILSEARKYKLNLIVANQFIGQLSDEIRDAIFGNVGSLIAYRVGADDGEYLESQFAPFSKNDLINSPMGNYYMKLLVDGHPTESFSAHLSYDEVLAVPKNKGIAEKIREMSRLKYGVPVKEVEAYIDQRSGFNEPEKPDPKDLIKDLF